MAEQVDQLGIFVEFPDESKSEPTKGELKQLEANKKKLEKKQAADKPQG